MSIEEVRGVVAGVLKRPQEKIGNDAHLIHDLSADSLSLIEIALGIEDHFHIEVTDDEAEAAFTIVAWQALVERKMKGHRGG